MSKQWVPEFFWDDVFWMTEIPMKGWEDLTFEENDTTDEGNPLFELCYAPEGRDDEELPLSHDESNLVAWVHEHSQQLYTSVMEALFKKYPEIRKKYLPYYEKEADKILPGIKSPKQLASLISVTSFFVHCIEKDGKPFIGISFHCSWDREHGLGVLTHGTKILEIGGAETAMTLWMAEKHL